MYCKKCGNELSSNVKFCNKCGTQVTEKIEVESTIVEEKPNTKIAVGIGIVVAVFVIMIGITSVMDMYEKSLKKQNKEYYYTDGTEIEYIDEDNWEIICFGTYEQDGNKENGKEPIEWIVLQEVDNRVLLLSKDVLDYKQYDSAYSNQVTWEESEMRSWLNNSFYYTAFGEEEKKSILPSELYNKDIELVDIDEEGKSQTWTSYAGKDTTDKIFLLSLYEIEKYAKPYTISSMSFYAIGQYKEIGQKKDCKGLSVDSETGNVGWWTRSPGRLKSGTEGYTTEISCVNKERNPDVWRMFYSYDADYYAGVRPAMWIEIRE